jgi:hypothetical protein
LWKEGDTAAHSGGRLIMVLVFQFPVPVWGLSAIYYLITLIMYVEVYKVNEEGEVLWEVLFVRRE